MDIIPEVDFSWKDYQGKDIVTEGNKGLLNERTGGFNIRRAGGLNLTSFGFDIMSGYFVLSAISSVDNIQNFTFACFAGGVSAVFGTTSRSPSSRS